MLPINFWVATKRTAAVDAVALFVQYLVASINNIIEFGSFADSSTERNKVKIAIIAVVDLLLDIRMTNAAMDITKA